MSIQLTDLPEGEVIVVEGHSVLVSSQSGYRLIAIEHHDEHVGRSVEEKDQYGNVRWITVQEKLSVARYVMFRDAESVMAEMAAKVAESRSAERDADQLLKELTAAKQAVDKKVLELEGRVTSHLQDKEYWHGQAGKEKELATRLEGDIAKIRTAIGGIRMKEILGQP